MSDKFNKLLSKFIDSFYKKNKKRKPGRPCMFPTIFYVEQICYVLINGISWNNLKPQYENKKCTGNAIYKKFRKWTDDGLFEQFYLTHYKKYKKEFGEHQNFFIDSTVVKNGNNSKDVGYSPKIKSKKSIKLSIICDDNKVVHDIHISKSHVHDSKLILPVLKNVIKTNKKINLIGDLGYLSNKNTLNKLKQKKVRLVTPIRKNMKKSKLTKKDEKLLKKRYVVEHVFAYLKRSTKKINIIYERNIQNYLSWLYIANTINILKIM